ncbi:MAG TPA: aromatic ring-hydroxylating dioxygenase subunit alpha [Kofleriaceae bacterium]|jgi:phenylpropionate dioxygenase-like ring-hydroxylating dioxygenase large terminal subunit|nr:aromatic ring-hydroxylating dioxygenase subunit alpha [Kofleriaceae bacterium]
MSSFRDDRAVAARILAHIESGTTDASDGVWREPVANYRSADRLRAELEVLRRHPRPLCPAAAVPEAGRFLTVRADGRSIVVVRGSDGVVRGLLNACRHRGNEIAEGAGSTKAFVCRYHGWTYDLDGALRHVPHQDGFPGLDPGCHGLVSVAVEERHGIVFLAGAGAPGGRAADAGELPELIAADQQVIDRDDSVLPINWKIYLESFLEGYHIRTLHRDTFYRYGFDNLTLVEHAGPHSRVTFPFQRIQKLAELPDAERRVEGRLTYVYQVFPCAIVAVLSRHTSMIVLEPIDAQNTRVINYVLSHRAIDGAADRAAAERDVSFVKQTGGAEDLVVAHAIQRSLASGANDVFTFGRHEGAITHFHRQLDAALAAL